MFVHDRGLAQSPPLRRAPCSGRGTACLRRLTALFQTNQ
jgi:hypothetical protein